MSTLAEQAAAFREPWRSALVGLLSGAGLAIVLLPFVLSESGVGLVIGILVYAMNLPLVLLSGYCSAGERCLGTWMLIGLGLLPVYGGLVGAFLGWRRGR